MNKEEPLSLSLLSMRMANSLDSQKLLEWRNQPEVRKFSPNTEIIEQAEHDFWFEMRIKRLATEPLFIFELGDEPIGMSRLDGVKVEENIFEVSILLDINFQGRGLGTSMLKKTCLFALNNLKAEMITALIHFENRKSEKLFTRIGFRLIGKVGNFKQLQLRELSKI